MFEGAEISSHYDPMIAKLVTHAATREAAIDLQADALDAFVIDGVEHNMPFLAAVMQHPRWRAGELSTGFIAEEFKGGFRPPTPEGDELQLLAAVAIAIDHLANMRRRAITQQMAGRAVRFSSRRSPDIGEARCGGAGGGHASRPAKVVRSPPRATAAPPWTWTPSGGPASRCGPARWTSRRVPVQVRPILNGYELS